MNSKILLTIFILTVSLPGYAFVDALVSGLITGWQHSENINNTAASNTINSSDTNTKPDAQVVKKTITSSSSYNTNNNSMHAKTTTDSWSSNSRSPLNFKSQSVRGTIATSEEGSSNGISSPYIANDIDKFLIDFNSKEKVVGVTPIVYSYDNTNQTIQSDRLADGLDDLRRQQKKELRRQSQEMKKMLERNNQELMRQKMNYDLIHNWKPLGTR